MKKFNERIDFVWQVLGYKSTRAFDRALGIPESQTCTITGPRQATPRIDYVQKIVELHPEVNTNWLLTGEEEWRKPPKGELEALKRKIEELTNTLEQISKEKEEVLEENSVFRNSIVNLAVNRPVNFLPVSIEKTPVNQKIRIFANSYANVAS